MTNALYVHNEVAGCYCIAPQEDMTTRSDYTFVEVVKPFKGKQMFISQSGTVYKRHRDWTVSAV